MLPTLASWILASGWALPPQHCTSVHLVSTWPHSHNEWADLLLFTILPLCVLLLCCQCKPKNRIWRRAGNEPCLYWSMSDVSRGHTVITHFLPPPSSLTFWVSVSYWQPPLSTISSLARGGRGWRGRGKKEEEGEEEGRRGERKGRSEEEREEREERDERRRGRGRAQRRGEEEEKEGMRE